MVREELGKNCGQRRRFSGVFERFGTKSGFEGRVEQTVLLVDIKDARTGRMVSNHLWFNAAKGFLALNLANGDLVEFDARVDDYVKGYVNEREGIDETHVDYRLVYPTKFKKAQVERSVEPEIIPLDCLGVLGDG